MSPTPWSLLGFCADCAEQTDANLRCTGCHTCYWALGGHKKDCKGFARARGDTNLGAQSRALARVSHMSGGAPGGALCLFCLDGGDATNLLSRGCAFRGSSGWAHATCLVQSVGGARVPAPLVPHFAVWIFCSTCKQHLTGLVELRLAIALWAKHARASPMWIASWQRVCALGRSARRESTRRPHG